MLEYDKIDISERIDVNKTSASKEWDICHYWYFKDKGFQCEPYLCNDCHNLMQKAMNFNDVTIVSVTGSDYRIHFWYMSQDNAINVMKSSDLTEKVDRYSFLLYIKINDGTTYYQRNRERILNKAKEYYKSNKEILRDKARNTIIDTTICLKKINKD